MAAGVSSQSNSSKEDDWRIRWQEMQEIVRRLGSKEKSTTAPVNSSYQMADSRKESKGRTLLLKIHLLRYSISWEELDRLFARFGRIKCIEVFFPEEQYHSRIRFKHKDSAFRAFESFNHRDIYDGCCRLELFLEAEIDNGFQEPKNRTPPHINEHRSTTTSSSESWERRMRMQENLHMMETLVKKLHMEPCRSLVQASTEEEDSVEESVLDEESELAWVDEITDRNQHIDIDSVSKSLSLQQLEDEALESLLVQPESSKAEDLTKASKVENKDDLEAPQIQSNGLEVNPNSCDVVIFDGVVKELAKLVGILIELMEIRLANSREFSWADLRMVSFDCLSSAHKAFVKMLSLGLVLADEHRVMVGHQIFDPGIDCLGIEPKVNLDTRVVTISGFHLEVMIDTLFHLKFIENHLLLMTFDKGRVDATAVEIQWMLIGMEMKFPYDRGRAAATFIGLSRSLILVFDPGGLLMATDRLRSWGCNGLT